jgi:hypothetical protein
MPATLRVTFLMEQWAIISFTPEADKEEGAVRVASVVMVEMDKKAGAAETASTAV